MLSRNGLSTKAHDLATGCREQADFALEAGQQGVLLDGSRASWAYSWTQVWTHRRTVFASWGRETCSTSRALLDQPGRTGRARELIEDREDGLYGERDVIEAVVVRLVVEAVGLRAATAAWRPPREAVLGRLESARAINPAEVRTVIDSHTWQLVVTTDAETLLQELGRATPFPRGRVVVTIGPSVAEARTAFWARAAPARDLRRDRRRRTTARAPARRPST
jgi:hypothetical protein